MGTTSSKSERHQNKDGSGQPKQSQAMERDRSFSGKSKKKRYLQQMKQDRRSQRVSKEQLYRLSSELKSTAWYLGRRLEFSEGEVNRILWMAPNEEAAKRVILITWRKKNGWKATNQSLVILLEQAGYASDEYKCILPQQENGHTNIYNKVDKTVSNTFKSNGYFRYDSHIDVSTANNKQKSNKSTKNEQSSVATNADDIIEFARRSWKKPSRKQNGHTQPANAVPQTAREPKTAPSIKTKHRRHSDFTISNAPKYDSESELDAVFREAKGNISSARVRHRDESNDPVTSHHEHTISTESQTEDYREQILRMSKRQFRRGSETYQDVYLGPSGDPNDSETDDVAGLYDDEASSSHISFFRFSLQPSYSNMLKDQHISGLAVTMDDKIVVAESINKEIQIFDKFGNFLTSFLTHSELNPKGLAVNNRNEIVVCCGKDVRLFSTTGEMLKIFGRGSFRNNSYSVVCDVIGNYYVSDIVGHTISVFDSEGNIRKRFGNFGENLINFNQPVALAINERKRLFISDSQNHCIKVYSLAGRPMEQIGERGSEDGLLWNPFGLCFDKRNELLVADCGNNRISLFDANYKFIRHILIEADGLQMPSLIRVTSTGQLIVCEWKSNEVKVYQFETSV